MSVGTLISWVDRVFLDANGVPLALGYLKPYITGTGTFKDLYADVGLTTSLGPVINFDSEGRIPPAFRETGGYDYAVYDVNDVLQYTITGDEDVGQTFAGTFGTSLTAGAKSVTDGYTVLAADQYITVNSSAGATTINLPAAADHPLLLTIKNVGTNTVSIVPNGTETFETLASAFAMPAAASPDFPSIVCANDGVSAWWVLASHAM